MGLLRSAAMLTAAMLLGCGDATATDEQPTLLVFAAASMADAIDAIADDFTEATGQRVVTSFAASSMLARQIEAGARADIFISADQRWMDALDAAGRIEPDSRFDLAANRLVIVGAVGEAPIAFDGSAPPGVMAIADPAHVPAGRYAREALEGLAWWSAVAPRMVTAPDVRAALRLVEIGEADLGVVYFTDASASHRVAVLGEIPESMHTPIRCPAALCADADASAAALLAFLRSDGALATLAAAGFEPVAGAAAADSP